jgi:hypothetical protein
MRKTREVKHSLSTLIVQYVLSHGPVVQWIEHHRPKVGVGGSTPSRVTMSLLNPYIHTFGNRSAAALNLIALPLPIIL